MIFGLQCLILYCYYFNSILSFQISPQQPQQYVFSTNKLSVHTSNVLAMLYFVSHFFFKFSPNFALKCWMPSFFVSLFPVDWFNSSLNFAAFYFVESYLVAWFIVILTIFTIWSSLCFVTRYSAVLILATLNCVFSFLRFVILRGKLLKILIPE